MLCKAFSAIVFLISICLISASKLTFASCPTYTPASDWNSLTGWYQAFGDNDSHVDSGSSDTYLCPSRMGTGPYTWTVIAPVGKPKGTLISPNTRRVTWVRPVVGRGLPGPNSNGGEVIGYSIRCTQPSGSCDYPVHIRGDYYLTVKVFTKDSVAVCPASPTAWASGAKVDVYCSGTCLRPNPLASGTTDANGVYVSPLLARGDRSLRICVTPADPNYSVSCPATGVTTTANTGCIDYYMSVTGYNWDGKTPVDPAPVLFGISRTTAACPTPPPSVDWYSATGWRQDMGDNVSVVDSGTTQTYRCPSRIFNNYYNWSLPSSFTNPLDGSAHVLPLGTDKGTLVNAGVDPVTWTAPVRSTSETIFAIRCESGLGICDYPVSVRGSYYLTVKAFSKPLADACPASPSTWLEGARIQVFSHGEGASVPTPNGSTDLVPLFSGTTDANGTLKSPLLPRMNRSLVICAQYTSPAGIAYTVSCPSAEIANGCLEYYMSANNTDPIPVLLGFSMSLADPWTTAIDGGIFADSIGDKIPSAGLISGGFSGHQINIKSTNAAFVFTRHGNAQSSQAVEDGKGGFTKNVDSLNGYLGRMTFLPPEASFVISKSDFSFEADKVYKMSVNTFNSIMGNPSSTAKIYSLASDGVALLYVYSQDGGNEMKISRPLVSNDSAKRLFIITNAKVTVAKEIGTLSANFTVSQTPNVTVGLLSSQGITIENDEAVAVANPIMLEGPFTSKASISFGRNLKDENWSLPSQAVKYNPKYLYELTKMDRSNPQEKSITSLGIYDTQWSYEE